VARRPYRHEGTPTPCASRAVSQHEVRAVSAFSLECDTRTAHTTKSCVAMLSPLVAQSRETLRPAFDVYTDDGEARRSAIRTVFALSDTNALNRLVEQIVASEDEELESRVRAALTSDGSSNMQVFLRAQNYRILDIDGADALSRKHRRLCVPVKGEECVALPVHVKTELQKKAWQEAAVWTSLSARELGISEDKHVLLSRARVDGVVALQGSVVSRDGTQSDPVRLGVVDENAVEALFASSAERVAPFASAVGERHGMLPTPLVEQLAAVLQNDLRLHCVSAACTPASARWDRPFALDSAQFVVSKPSGGPAAKQTIEVVCKIHPCSIACLCGVYGKRRDSNSDSKPSRASVRLAMCGRRTRDDHGVYVGCPVHGEGGGVDVSHAGDAPQERCCANLSWSVTCQHKKDNKTNTRAFFEAGVPNKAAERRLAAALMAAAACVEDSEALDDASLSETRARATRWLETEMCRVSAREEPLSREEMYVVDADARDALFSRRFARLEDAGDGSPRVGLLRGADDDDGLATNATRVPLSKKRYNEGTLPTPLLATSHAHLFPPAPKTKLARRTTSGRD
jgi:hypothetical protein